MCRRQRGLDGSVGLSTSFYFTNHPQPNKNIQSFPRHTGLPPENRIIEYSSLVSKISILKICRPEIVFSLSHWAYFSGTYPSPKQFEIKNNGVLV